MAEDSAALAAELAKRTEAEAGMAAALVELERHPGHQTLSAGTTTGITAQRWASASATLAGLWEDFATYRGVLDEARARPTERRRLLRESSIEVARPTTRWFWGWSEHRRATLSRGGAMSGADALFPAEGP